jgi:hypothetical protein
MIDLVEVAIDLIKESSQSDISFSFFDLRATFDFPLIVFYELLMFGLKVHCLILFLFSTVKYSARFLLIHVALS